MSIYKRILCAVLSAILLWGVFPLTTRAAGAAAVSDAQLEETIETQIRAFAKSINQSNADDAAASALAKHGITGRGKKLSVGKSHALTATLMNSEMMQVALIDSCISAIQYMQLLDLKVLPKVIGEFNWYSSNRIYGFTACTTEGDVGDFSIRDFVLVDRKIFTGNANAYDDSLEWIVGGSGADLKIERQKTTATQTTYQVTCVVTDCFDFDTKSNSGFSNLISGFAALLFKEFDWEAKVSFILTVPYSCTHCLGQYHWNYDGNAHILISDTTGEYTENNVVRHDFITGSGDQSYYYQLGEAVRLYHDKPWVMEYKISNPSSFAFSPLNAEFTVQNFFRIVNRQYIFAVNEQCFTLTQSQMDKYGLTSSYGRRVYEYGTPLNSLFTYSRTKIYTFHLENVIDKNGINMIWVTVYDDQGQQIMEAPMNDYYLREPWEKQRILQDTDHSGISGQDFLINYIGTKTSAFSADYFELFIWENGVDGGNTDSFVNKVTKPTCTAKGYTTRTCAHCGYSYKTDYVDKKAHTYKAAVTRPSCTAQGYTTYTCSCGDSYVGDYVAVSAHSYVDNVCTVCGDRQRLAGDLDGDGVVNTTDVVKLRRYIAGGYDVELTDEIADLDGDGVVNTTDVVKLRRYIAGGYDVVLG